MGGSGSGWCGGRLAPGRECRAPWERYSCSWGPALRQAMSGLPDDGGARLIAQTRQTAPRVAVKLAGERRSSPQSPDARRDCGPFFADYRHGLAVPPRRFPKAANCSFSKRGRRAVRKFRTPEWRPRRLSRACSWRRRGASCPGRRPRLQTKVPTVPVDTPPPARVAGPMPHFRKFAFLMGATATMLALLVANQLIGLLQ